MEYIHTCDSPVGKITMASDGESLLGLWLEGQKYYAQTMKTEPMECMLPIFEETEHWLEAYFYGNESAVRPKLAPRGSAFRQMVWEILLTIPRGETMTYGQIAALVASRMGRSTMSAQAVGGAVGHNPISLIIPCHRVVGSDDSLTGYAGGIHIKEQLLKLEGATCIRS